jgi:hypothetical protein
MCLEIGVLEIYFEKSCASILKPYNKCEVRSLTICGKMIVEHFIYQKSHKIVEEKFQNSF